MRKKQLVGTGSLSFFAQRAIQKLLRVVTSCSILISFLTFSACDPCTEPKEVVHIEGILDSSRRRMKQRERLTRTDVQILLLEGVRFPSTKIKAPKSGLLGKMHFLNAKCFSHKLMNFTLSSEKESQTSWVFFAPFFLVGFKGFKGFIYVAWLQGIIIRCFARLPEQKEVEPTSTVEEKKMADQMGRFLQMVGLPNNHGVFLLKLTILECFWRYHHFRKRPTSRQFRQIRQGEY